MASEWSADIVCESLATQRIQPYQALTGEDPDQALKLYVWGARMASACFEIIGHLEILLRNALDTSLADHFGEEARGIPWFLCTPPVNQQMAEAVATVRSRLSTSRQYGRTRDTRHQIIAGLSFGFWTQLLGAKHEELWRMCLHRAFPGSDGTRKQVAAQLEGIRKFRNRVAHHDSMLRVDVLFEMRRVFQMAGFLGAHCEAWLRSIDRTEDVYSARPSTGIDTVVVAAREAWPLYEACGAYVCQPNRWFQPVSRLAFYADKEIKTPVPEIRHRRDNVPWTDAEVARLENGDRTDRKIAAVIREARHAEWTEGAYQVFLLSAAGDSRTRTLGRPLAHRATGRGSAFTQRQRYVSLHHLETAQTTDDL